MISKRETLFLSGVMVAAVVLLLDRIGPSFSQHNTDAEERVEAARTYVEQKRQQIGAMLLKPHEKMIMKMLQSECPDNPFARQLTGMIADQKRINRLSTIEPVLSYNGYMRSGERYVALVNDEDYEVGNKIDHVPLKIREITPDRIDVENPNTVSRARLSVKILPLEVENEEL